MADAHAKPHHDYHLVNPSPWPAVGSISAFIMAVGAIGWMHHMYDFAPYVFGIGVIGVLYTMLSWWGDVIKEAEHGGYHTRVVQISHRYGMILFIASEVMFFVAWFWAFFNSALFPADAEDVGRRRNHVVHPHDGADRHDEGRDRADRRPRARIDEVVVMLRFAVGVGHFGLRSILVSCRRLRRPA